MKIAIGSDHRGCQLAQQLASTLNTMGHAATILSDLTTESSDYPDAACKVGNAVRLGHADRGVLICGSGIGMSIAANKIHGVRAALVHDELSARMSRAHNDSNVLCLSADLIGPKVPTDLLQAWIETEFEGGRHARRVEKIARIESGDPVCGG